MKENLCHIIKLLSMGELYNRVQEIQHQGFSPPEFAIINNVPYYALVNGCSDDCKGLQHKNLCNNEDAIKKFIKDNYPIRCTFIDTNYQCNHKV